MTYIDLHPFLFGQSLVLFHEHRLRHYEVAIDRAGQMSRVSVWNQVYDGLIVARWCVLEDGSMLAGEASGRRQEV